MPSKFHQIPECVVASRELLIKGGKEIQSPNPPEKNLADFMEKRACDLGDKVFLDFISYENGNSKRSEKKSYSFRKFHEASNQFANVLKSLDFKVEDSVGYIGENIPEMHLTYIGTGKLGGLCAPLNPKDSLEKWLLTFQDCQVKYIVVQENLFQEKFFDLVQKLKTLKTILVVTQGAIPSHPDLPCSVHCFEEMLNQQDKELTSSGELGWKDPYLLVYTSGTTGNPKGVVISLDGIWRCANSLNDHYGFGPKDSTYAQLSGFHVNHIVVSFWGALAGGYRLFMTNRFCADDYFPIIQEENITISSVVPTNLAYALKAELEKGELTQTKDFQKHFREYLKKKVSPFINDQSFTENWEKALEQAKILDYIKFQGILGKNLSTCPNTKEEFTPIFNQYFSIGFAKFFQPLFQEKYHLSWNKLTLICGAGDLALDLALQFSRMTGLQITQGWGMSEGTCYNSMSIPRPSWLLYWLTIGSIGLEMTTTNMCIVATNAELKPEVKKGKLVQLDPKEMAKGEVGMIAMRGHVSSLGYYNNDAVNRESYVDGWLLTGDAGCALKFSDASSFRGFIRMSRQAPLADLLEKYPHIEERYYPLLKKLKETGNHTALTQVLTKEFSQIKNGLFYFIKGRIKDIIIAKGQNIPCDEIEAGALVHPGIFEAVAVGILDRQDGEVPGIVATRHPESSTSATELLEFTRSRRILPRIQWPVMAAIVESLPKTPTGKYQRIRAREVFSVVNLIEDLKTPATTAKFKIQILDLAVTPDYDLSRRPKEI